MFWSVYFSSKSFWQLMFFMAIYVLNKLLMLQSVKQCCWFFAGCFIWQSLMKYFCCCFIAPYSSGSALVAENDACWHQNCFCKFVFVAVGILWQFHWSLHLNSENLFISLTPTQISVLPSFFSTALQFLFKACLSCLLWNTLSKICMHVWVLFICVTIKN